MPDTPMPAQRRLALPLTLAVYPRRVIAVMVVVSLVLFVLHIVAFLVGPAPGGGGWARIAGLFNMDSEVSIPTWWSQTLLVVSALLLVHVWSVVRSDERLRSDSRYWLGLAAVMLVASVDEGSSIHEIAAAPLQSFLRLEVGAFANAWVILALLVVAALVIIFLRFFVRLPGKTRGDFALALGVYLLGAVGMEMLAAFLVTTGEGILPLALRFVQGGEELLELIGAILFINALFRVLARPRHAETRRG